MTCMPLRSLRIASGAALLALLVAACGGDETPPANAATPAKAPAEGKAPAGRGAPGGGNRTGGSVILSTADIHKVVPGIIEAGIAVSGNLRPIETVSVRARDRPHAR
jgi:hypothetical protein